MESKTYSKFNERPVNPKTGKHYAKTSKAYRKWFDGLSERDKGIIADLEAF